MKLRFACVWTFIDYQTFELKQIDRIKQYHLIPYLLNLQNHNLPCYKRSANMSYKMKHK